MWSTWYVHILLFHHQQIHLQTSEYNSVHLEILIIGFSGSIWHNKIVKTISLLLCFSNLNLIFSFWVSFLGQITAAHVICICLRGNICSYVWINNVPEPLPAAGVAALSPQVPACGHPHTAHYFLPGFWRKDLLVRLAWLRSHSFSQKSDDIHVLFARSSWKCLFEQKILSVKSCLQHRARWALLLLPNAPKEMGGWKGKGNLCLFGVCAAGLRERPGEKEILKLMRSWASIW